MIVAQALSTHCQGSPRMGFRSNEMFSPMILMMSLMTRPQRIPVSVSGSQR